jgi:hypothetical protein
VKYKYWYLLVFGLALLLRFSLVVVNREATDAHEAVAKIIARTGTLPPKNDCWECFQPKLFHFVFAGLLVAFRMVNNPGYQQNVLGQLANFTAGAFTLVVVFVFVRDLPGYNEKLKLLAFSLVALNPALIGINSQATNDTFVILFSSLALIYCVQFFRSQRVGSIVLCALFCLLAITSKTNGWVAILAIVAAMVIWSLSGARRATNLGITVLFFSSILVLSIVNPLDQDVANTQKYGPLLLMNVARDPLPPFSGPYTAGARGIWYIGDGYLTFRFLDLLRHPRLERGSTVYLPHQTSFWTVLFGTAHSIHFENIPPSWSTAGPALFPLLQLSFTLALLPTVLLLLGGVKGAYQLTVGLVQHKIAEIQATGDGLFVIVFFGYLAFEVLYSLQYRTVYVIKAIFVFPALLSFPFLFMSAARDLYSLVTRSGKRWAAHLIDSTLVALLACYVIDVTVLIVRSSLVYLQHHTPV